MQGDVLAPLVRAYVGTRTSGDALLEALRPHVHHVAGRYPHSYFEGGRRDDDSLAVLEALVFTRCADTARAGDPFRDRPPFRACVDERLSDLAIRFHTCHGPLSVTREVLRDQYARQIPEDPALLRRDRLYRELGLILAERVESVVRPAAAPLWRVPPRGPVRVRDLDQVRQRLLGSELPLGELAVASLRLAGQPVSRSRLSHLIADILGPGDDGQAPTWEDATAGLAHGEFADQLHVDDEPVPAQSGPPAAAEVARPGAWSTGDHTLYVDEDPDGGWRVLLEGPRAAILAGRAMVPGVWVRLDGELPTPPVLTLQDGSTLVLSR